MIGQDGIKLIKSTVASFEKTISDLKKGVESCEKKSVEIDQKNAKLLIEKEENKQAINTANNLIINLSKLLGVSETKE